jgi:hypothetical protein
MSKESRKIGEGNDFNLEEIAPKMSQHDSDIAAIFKRTELLENKLNSDEGFACYFNGVLERSKTMEKIFKEFIHKAIQEDDRSVLSKTLRRFGTLIGWVISLVIAGIIGAIIKSKIG